MDAVIYVWKKILFLLSLYIFYFAIYFVIALHILPSASPDVYLSAD